MRIAILGLVLASVAAGCKEGPTVPDPDGNGGPTPAVAILLSPGSQTLPQGGSGSVTVALTRSGGFVGEIALSLEGVPNGVVATPSPATVPVGGSASTIALNVGGAVVAGSYSVTVRASGAGVVSKTANFNLTVTAVSTPGFTLGGTVVRALGC